MTNSLHTLNLIMAAAVTFAACMIASASLGVY